jgi:hypothetical protein
MARQSQNKFIKRKKELDRMQKAREKMARRQGERNRSTESEDSHTSEQPLETSNK